jgi:hypothetical protein
MNPVETTISLGQRNTLERIVGRSRYAAEKKVK